MIEKIVSGGQTGVDQAGLFVAHELGFDIGGWCPKDGTDENGQDIRKKYSQLKATKTSDPAERTRLNVCDSDGTLIIFHQSQDIDGMKDGTPLTEKEAKHLGKPYLKVKLPANQAEHQAIRDWVETNNIRVLNIAGPRESTYVGIYDLSREFFRELFPSLKAAARPRCG